jgi:hypothetical protein
LPSCSADSYVADDLSGEEAGRFRLFTLQAFLVVFLRQFLPKVLARTWPTQFPKEVTERLCDAAMRTLFRFSALLSLVPPLLRVTRPTQRPVELIRRLGLVTLGAIFDVKTFVAYDVSVSVLTRACGFRFMIAADGAG